MEFNKYGGVLITVKFDTDTLFQLSFVDFEDFLLHLWGIFHIWSHFIHVSACSRVMKVIQVWLLHAKILIYFFDCLSFLFLSQTRDVWVAVFWKIRWRPNHNKKLLQMRVFDKCALEWLQPRGKCFFRLVETSTLYYSTFGTI